jgi:uncharacterized repeat protein (TIGR01451 family)
MNGSKRGTLTDSRFANGKKEKRPMEAFSRRRGLQLVGLVAAIGLVTGGIASATIPSNNVIDAAPHTTENDALTFNAATWVDLQRVTGADPLVDVDMRGNGRVFVNFPWGRITTPTLPNIVARSLDHGDTFRTLFDESCPTSNSQPRCGDPGIGNSTLALSPDNDNVYLSGIVGFQSLSASASSNAGDTWPNFYPVTAPGGMDRPWLLAPGGQTAHLAWNNLALSQPGQLSVQYATTSDGGASWIVDPEPKYAAGGMTRLVMDRSAQSPARGTIYQVFGDPANFTVGVDKVRVAVSRDATKTFETHEVGGNLADVYGVGSLPWVTVDTAGNLYAVWWTDSGSDVVMRTSNISDPANDPRVGGEPGSTWSPYVHQVSTGAAETAVVGNVAAGSPGNVAIVYYGTNGLGIPDTQPPNAEWYPFVAHSANALDPNPAFTQSVIGHRPVHKGGLCTDPSGQGCPEGSTRGLRNWMNVGIDPDGRLYAAWSDDNNHGNRTGIRFAKQLTGPSLMTGNPPLNNPAPSSPMIDPSGDATWPNRTTGGTNLPGADLTRVAVHRDGTTIRFWLSIADATRFEEAVNAVPSVPTADRLLFVVRFESAEQEYFAAYEYLRGGEDRGFTGRIDAQDGVEARRAFVNAIGFYQDGDAATATVTGNTITITQDLSAFAGLDSPPRLLSVVGAALIGPSEENETRFNLLNTVDATRAFDHELVEADLSITKTGPSGRVPTGRNMTYTLAVTNNGPDEASDVVVTDTLPPSVTFVGAAIDLPVGFCDPPSGGVLTCHLGPIGSGVERRIYITVKPTQAGMITNSASVASPTPDYNLANNDASVDTAICRITSRRSSIPCG